MSRKASVFNSVPVWLVVAVVVLVGGAAMCQAQDKKTTEEVETLKMTFLELLERGGLQFMIPIGLCSLLGVTIIIERLFVLRKSSVMPKGFLAGLKGVFRQERADRQAGLDYCTANGSPLSRVVAAGIRKLHKSEDAVERAIEDAGALEVDRLRRNMHLLFGISAVAPMLGLLGTVWGMIEAFQATSVHTGDAKAANLATGIYQALVTTFAGLVVAIPVLILYYYFQGRIEQTAHQLNEVTMDFVDHYTATNDDGGAVAPAAA